MPRLNYKGKQMSLTDKQLKAISKSNEYDGVAELNDGEGLIAKYLQMQISHFSIDAVTTVKNAYV